MRKLFSAMLVTGVLVMSITIAFASEVTPNLVRDGGMERWDEASPGSSRYNHLTVKRAWQMSVSETGNLLVPAVFSQLSCTEYVMKRETEAVYSGESSLRLSGSIYLEKVSEGAYDTRSGDMYIVRYMAKGAGTITMHFTVYGEGGPYLLERKGEPVADTWTLIEQRFLIGGSAPTTIYPRLAVTGEVLVDDIFIGRMLREDEHVEAQPVPKEHDARVAFASAAAQPMVIDGKLDEDCWQSAVKFSGFRLAHEQTLLATERTTFQALYDEQAVYLGVEVQLADAQRVARALAAKPLSGDRAGDIYTDRHSVEVFLQPPGQGWYVQYVASLAGYRYDGMGMDASWNGQWRYGVSVDEDGWNLEMMIPAGDLKLDRIPSMDGWRMNITCNREHSAATWAAVGNNFHTPFAFGTLVTKEFAQWRREKVQEWAVVKQQIADVADTPEFMFGDRIARTEQYMQTLPAEVEGEGKHWEHITRMYALLNFVDAAYRSLQAELRYARWFSTE